MALDGFIHKNQKMLIIETENIQFGNNTVLNFSLMLDEDKVSATPNVTIQSSDLPTGTTIEITKNNTSKIDITIMLGGIIADYILGKKYTITFLANNKSDDISVIFLYSRTYNIQDWQNANDEVVAGYFAIQEIREFEEIRSKTLNSKFKAIFEFLTSLQFKILDITNRYRLNKSLPDIVNCAIYSGAIPEGFSGTIIYTPNSTNISYIMLKDENAIDKYTKISFSYISEKMTITNTSVDPKVIYDQNISLIDKISVERTTDESGKNRKYLIANILTIRNNTTFTSENKSIYSITMPLITGWTVAE